MLEEVRKRVDKVFYSVPQPTKLKEAYERAWKCEDEEGYTVYGCGHSHKGVLILDSNPLSISAYLEWKDSVGFDGDKSQCFDCYVKEEEEIKEAEEK